MRKTRRWVRKWNPKATISKRNVKAKMEKKKKVSEWVRDVKMRTIARNAWKINCSDAILCFRWFWRERVFRVSESEGLNSRWGNDSLLSRRMDGGDSLMEWAIVVVIISYGWDCGGFRDDCRLHVAIVRNNGSDFGPVSCVLLIGLVIFGLNFGVLKNEMGLD